MLDDRVSIKIKNLQMLDQSTKYAKLAPLAQLTQWDQSVQLDKLF